LSTEIQYYLWTFILAFLLIAFDLFRRLHIVRFKLLFSILEYGLFITIPFFLISYIRSYFGLAKKSLVISAIIFIVILLLYGALFDGAYE